MSVVDLYNKVDRLGPDERRRILEANPGAQLISAATGEGADGLLRVVASRLALDTHRITIRLDRGNAFDRAQISKVYRVGQVVSHLAVGDQVVIEADVPRRFLERFMPSDGVVGGR